MAAGDKVLSRLSSTAIAMSKHFLPDADRSRPKSEPGLMAKLGAKTVVAATLRAVQLLGRQFVLGQTMGAHARGRHCPQEDPNCATATTCWARARAPMQMRLRYLQVTRMLLNQ
jgi:hypothetical protein